MIELHTSPAPEGRRVSITLEEPGTPPHVVHVLEACRNKVLLPDFL
jgi:hypothetical protein